MRCKKGMTLHEKFEFHCGRTSVGCWIWTEGFKGNGLFKYPIIIHEKKHIKAHRYSYQYFNGPIPEGMYACHTCDNTRCVNPKHLFIGTAQDNSDDCVSKGRQSKTFEPSKLNSRKVQLIRYLRHKHTVLELARKFRVGIRTIYHVLNRTTYKDVPDIESLETEHSPKFINRV